jgi:hypothetical protein
METTPTTTNAISSLGTTTHAFIAAHPLGVAIVGGAIIGMGAYYLMNKFFKKAESPKEATA